MPTHDEPLRERLLSRLPQPADSADYRNAVTSMLQAKERAFRRQRWQTHAIFVFVVLLSMVYLYLGSVRIDTPKGAWFGSLACFWLLFGTVYVVKLFISQLALDLLKEVKQVQVQVLELQAQMLERKSPEPRP